VDYSSSINARDKQPILPTPTNPCITGAAGTQGVKTRISLSSSSYTDTVTSDNYGWHAVLNKTQGYKWFKKTAVLLEVQLKQLKIVMGLIVFANSSFLSPK
jgi:hypothetical protein